MAWWRGLVVLRRVALVRDQGGGVLEGLAAGAGGWCGGLVLCSGAFGLLVDDFRRWLGELWRVGEVRRCEVVLAGRAAGIGGRSEGARSCVAMRGSFSGFVNWRIALVLLHGVCVLESPPAAASHITSTSCVPVPLRSSFQSL